MKRGLAILSIIFASTFGAQAGGVVDECFSDDYLEPDVFCNWLLPDYFDLDTLLGLPPCFPVPTISDPKSVPGYWTQTPPPGTPLSGTEYVSVLYSNACGDVVDCLIMVNPIVEVDVYVWWDVNADTMPNEDLYYSGINDILVTLDDNTNYWGLTATRFDTVNVASYPQGEPSRLHFINSSCWWGVYGSHRSGRW